MCCEGLSISKDVLRRSRWMIGGQREERYAIPRAMSSMIYDAASDDMERERDEVRTTKKKNTKAAHDYS